MLLEHCRETKSPEKFCPERYSNPDLCDADAVFHQLGYQVVMWVYDKLVDIGYKCDVIDHTRILSIGRELAWNGG